MIPGAIATARRWKRPYTSVERAWVDALGLEPSASWRPVDSRAARPSGTYEGLAGCFENRRAVLL